VCAQLQGSLYIDALMAFRISRRARSRRQWLEKDAHGARNRHSDKEKFRSGLNRPESREISERAIKRLRKLVDFQAEYEDSKRLGVQAARPPVSGGGRAFAQ
jgi:hypothetical protein